MTSPVYVTVGDPKLFSIKYEDAGQPARRTELEALWRRFVRRDPSTAQDFNILYRTSSRAKDVQVDWLMPPTAPIGIYRAEVFIPGKHATTKQALFTVAHDFRIENGQPAYEDTLVIVNMYDQFDAWYPLGTFILNPGNHPWSGRVRQYDMSLEAPPTEIAFGPVRWVPILPKPEGQAQFDSPVGTQTERSGPFSTERWKWVGTWFDSTPFLCWYFLGYHTGADLNLSQSSDADRNAPVYAVSDGTVIFAGQGRGKWGNIAVIEHPEGLVTLPNGQTRRQTVWSRYGHLADDIRVKAGQTVKRGDLVGFIGLALDSKTGWHLHFDIAYDERIRVNPSHWPDLRTMQRLEAEKKTDTKEYRDVQAVIMREVVATYVDPLKFLKANHE
jgi:murein DD-endopeptidase MepM/ murein hydrolase activator NlpD